MTHPTDCAAMTGTKHTATPWEAEPETGRSAWIKGTTGEWAALSCGDTDESARANAAFIVKAVNAYDDLRAQLAAKDAEIERWKARDSGGYAPDGKTWKDALWAEAAKRGEVEAQLAAATKRLAALLDEAEDIFVCMADATGIDRHNYPKPFVEARAFLASNPTPEDAGNAVEADAIADQVIGQIEERFPNWRQYRDLIDCIDCTLHDLRSAQP